MCAGEWILDEKELCEGNIRTLEKMEAFIGKAQDGGVVSSSEAEFFKHSMHHYVRKLMCRIDDVCVGSAMEPLFGERTSLRKAVRTRSRTIRDSSLIQAS